MDDILPWVELVQEYEGDTWDTVVECHDGLPSEFSDRICQLGYYGKEVHFKHAQALHNSERWVPPKPFGVHYHGCDGKDESWFDTLEEAAAYIKPRIEWTESDTKVCTDYASYVLDGFTLKDIGIDWRDRLP